MTVEGCVRADARLGRSEHGSPDAGSLAARVADITEEDLPLDAEGARRRADPDCAAALQLTAPALGDGDVVGCGPHY